LTKKLAFFIIFVLEFFSAKNLAVKITPFEIHVTKNYLAEKAENFTIEK
jgi:hypothetical protein